MSYSVLMSVYRKETAPHFQLALESMLKQTVSPDEIVLVCDGPLTDELDIVIKLFQEKYGQLIRVHRLPDNLGLGLALRAGLELCTHEFVARMDTDDIAIPDRMEKQLAVLQKNSSISVVGGQIAEFSDTPDNIIDYRCVPETDEDIRKWIVFRNPINHMTATFRKSHVEAAGSYRDFLWFEDYHLWARMLAQGFRLHNLNDICVCARVDNNLYKRRAGFLYFKQVVKLQRFLQKNELTSQKNVVINICVRFFTCVLCPNWLRAFFYKYFLRKRKQEKK